MKRKTKAPARNSSAKATTAKVAEAARLARLSHFPTARAGTQHMFVLKALTALEIVERCPLDKRQRDKLQRTRDVALRRARELKHAARNERSMWGCKSAVTAG